LRIDCGSVVFSRQDDRHPTMIRGSHSICWEPYAYSLRQILENSLWREIDTHIHHEYAKTNEYSSPTSIIRYSPLAKHSGNTCQVPESVKHSLLQCQHYNDKWWTLRQSIRSPFSLATLIGIKVPAGPLFKTTKRFSRYSGSYELTT
jgi:hypothetical protein